MLVYERFRRTYSLEMFPGKKGEKSVGISVSPPHTTVLPVSEVPLHVQPSGQAFVPLLCQSTEDTMNDKTISHFIFL
jgi:hypothetical protein